MLFVSRSPYCTYDTRYRHVFFRARTGYTPSCYNLLSTVLLLFRMLVTPAVLITSIIRDRLNTKSTTSNIRVLLVSGTARVRFLDSPWIADSAGRRT